MKHMRKARDWEMIHSRWDSEFQSVLDALTLAAEECVSKRTRKQIDAASDVVSRHKYLILTILKAAENEDRILRGSDFVAEVRRR